MIRAGSPAVRISRVSTSLPSLRETAFNVPGVKGTRQQTWKASSGLLLTEVIGEPVLLLRPPVKLDDTQSEWESRSVTSGEINRRWTEGPYTMKKGDTYYMMYSANYYKGKNYAVGYATAKSPLGPFVKSNDNPVLQKNVEQGGIVTGTGHNSVTWSKDGKQMYCVYHGYTQKTGNERVVFIDKMGIDENGKLYVDGPNAE